MRVTAQVVLEGASADPRREVVTSCRVTELAYGLCLYPRGLEINGRDQYELMYMYVLLRLSTASCRIFHLYLYVCAYQTLAI